MNKKLVILDLNKDIDLKIDESDIIQTSTGCAKIGDSNLINPNFYNKERFEIFKKKLFKKLSKNLQFVKKNLSNYDPHELEIFNLRNDKYKIYDKIFIFSELTKYLSKRKNQYQTIELISDNNNYFKFYKSLKIKNLKISFFKHNEHRIGKIYFIQKSINFYLKTFILIIFSKILIKKESYKKKMEACLSLFPLYYKDKENLFYPKKYLNINFLITDESHLGNSLLRNILLLQKLKKINNIVIIEKHINIMHLLCCLFRNLFSISYKLNKILNKKTFFDRMDISLPINNLIIMSILNRSKLSIYDKALLNIFKSFQIKKFHYFMFEYNFGFYLSNILKKKIPSLTLVGYQHGIFSDRLMWVELLKKYKFRDKYYPHVIICKYLYSLNSYKKYFSTCKLKFKKSLNNYKNLKIKVKKTNKLSNKKKILVFLGLHDTYEMINILRHRNDIENKNKFYLKFHPKKPLDQSIRLAKNFIFNNLTKIKNFDLIILSSSSTMVYDFLKYKIPFKILKSQRMAPLTPKKIDNRISYF